MADVNLITTAELAERCGIRMGDVHNLRQRHAAELVPAFVAGGVLFWRPEQVELCKAIYWSQKPSGKFRKKGD